MMPLSLQTLTEAVDLHSLLDYPLEFRLLSSTERQEAAKWFTVESEELFDPIAEDGTGGRFMLGQRSGHILFVSSEGQAGVIAASLEELLRLLLLPVAWQDLLKFSGGGQLIEMQRCLKELAQPLHDDEFERAEELAAAQAELIQELGLAADPQSVSLLQHAVNVLSKRVRVVSPDGHAFDELFNTFTVDTLKRRPAS